VQQALQQVAPPLGADAEASKTARSYGLVKYGFETERDIPWPESPRREE
jgi:hypothetical protein